MAMAMDEKYFCMCPWGYFSNYLKKMETNVSINLNPKHSQNMTNFFFFDATQFMKFWIFMPRAHHVIFFKKKSTKRLIFYVKPKQDILCVSSIL